jgi:5-methylcytosine-specific restriction endonuclease McrA
LLILALITTNRNFQSVVAKIRKELSDMCAYCSTPLNGLGEIEHKRPLSRGGDNSLSNITLACYQCNKDKYAKTVEEYREWRVKNKLPNRAIDIS